MTNKLVSSQSNESTFDFFNLFKKNIFHSKHLIKIDNTWRTLDKYLSMKSIINTYNNNITIKKGFFSCIQTKMLCIDIDAHNVNESMIESISYSKLYKINSLFGTEPSALEKTKHGLHLYYFLTDYINSLYLTEQIKFLFKSNDIDAEVRGSFNEGLSLPIKNNFIDLQSKIEPIVNGVFTSLFSDIKNVSFTKNIYSNNITIYNGTSNDVLCQFVPRLRFRNNYSVEQTSDIISSMFDSSYTGELTNKYRLMKRVSSFKKNTNNITYVKKTIENKSLYLTMNDIIAKTKDYNLSDKQVSSLKIIVNALLNAKENFKNACESKENLYYVNELYSYSKFYDKQGATPVPSNLLKQVNSHYNFYLSLLKDIGFLNFANGRHYDVSKHVCIHYIIGFVKETIKTLTTIADLINQINSIDNSINILPIHSNSIFVLNCLSSESEDAEILKIHQHS